MNDLQARVRRAIDAARTGHDPSSADAARVRAALKARVLAEPLLIQPGPTHPPPVPGAASGVLGKVMIALGVGSSLGFAAGLYAAAVLWPGMLARPLESAGVEHTPVPAAPPPAVAPHAVEAIATPRDAPESEARAAPTAADSGDRPETSARSPAPPRPTARGASRRSPTSAAASPIQAELDGLRRAQELLHQGRPGWALARLDELDRAGVGSMLSEERAATRAIAECQLGGAAQRPADEYARRFPRSAHLERVRSSCSGAPQLGAPASSGGTPAGKVTPVQTERRGPQHEK